MLINKLIDIQNKIKNVELLFIDRQLNLYLFISCRNLSFDNAQLVNKF